MHSVSLSGKNAPSASRYGVDTETVQRPSASPSDFQEAFAGSLAPKLTTEGTSPASENKETEAWKAFAPWAPILSPVSIPLSLPTPAPRGPVLGIGDAPNGADSADSSPPGDTHTCAFASGSLPGGGKCAWLSTGATNLASQYSRPDAYPAANRSQPVTDAGPDIPAGETAFSLRLSSSDSPTDSSPNAVQDALTAPHTAAAPPETSGVATGPGEDASRSARDEHSDSRAPARQIPAVLPETAEEIPQVRETASILFTTDSSATRTPLAAARADAPKPALSSSQPDPAESATWKSIERLETLTQLKQPTGPVREIAWKAETGGEQGVLLRLVRSAGEVRATVHSADSRITRALRASLNELLAALRGQGFHAEIEIPGSGALHKAPRSDSESKSRRPPRHVVEPVSPTKVRSNTSAWMEHWLHSLPHSTE